MSDESQLVNSVWWEKARHNDPDVRMQVMAVMADFVRTKLAELGFSGRWPVVTELGPNDYFARLTQAAMMTVCGVPVYHRDRRDARDIREIVTERIMLLAVKAGTTCVECGATLYRL